MPCGDIRRGIFLLLRSGRTQRDAWKQNDRGGTYDTAESLQYKHRCDGAGEQAYLLIYYK